MKTTLVMPHKKEKGQIIVILALVFIGLIAIIGLAIDLGYMYVSYARLSRAVDAAALAATTQFKKNVAGTDLDRAAREFLVLNGVPDDKSLAALVETCDTNPSDTALCFDPPRKVVRVTASENVPMFFLSLVGITNVPIKVSANAEAAAVDLVLVIDKSDSMAFCKDPDCAQPPYDIPSVNGDPQSCNSTNVSFNSQDWDGNCHPFMEVKKAAYDFVNTFMDENYDRIAIIVFDVQSTPVNFGNAAAPVHLYGGYGKKEAILTVIRELWLYDGFKQTGIENGNAVDRRPPSMTSNHYFTDTVDGKAPECPYLQGGVVPISFAPCRLKGAGGYYGIDCAGKYHTPKDYSECGSTNTGAALYDAAAILENEGREESLWVTILLTDGVANLAYDDSIPQPLPICPPLIRGQKNPYCSDQDPDSRHPKANILTDYDVMDYTRDQADVLATEAKSIIFAIGLGSDLTDMKYTADPSKPPQGAALLDYIAYKGQTGGYYPATPAALSGIFLKIANKIATRLTK